MDVLNKIGAEHHGLLHLMRRQKKHDRQSARRGASKHMRPQAKHLLCTLILSLAPWKQIAMIFLVLEARRKKKYETWSQAEMEQIAMETIVAQPTLVENADNLNHSMTICARKWLYECNVALWVIENNKKGIALPPHFVINKYCSQWGIGPHNEKVDRHLCKFRKWRGWKKWMTSFRENWNFKYTICPTMSPLNDDQIRMKASLRLWKESTSCQTGDSATKRKVSRTLVPKMEPILVPIFGTTFWSQHIFHDLGKKLVPKMEPILVPIFGTSFGPKMEPESNKKWNHRHR